MSDIRGWLEGLDLGEYAEAFEAEKIAPDDLTEFSEDDLGALGLPMGPRRRVLKAARALNVAPSTETATAPMPPREAERRQITVMFCDLVGSTALSEQLDPEDLRDVMRAYQDATGTAITRFGGHIAQTLGDGLMVYFGYPIAHEDDAQRAIAAGLDILSAMTSLNDDMSGRTDTPLAVRVGIHTGMVVAGEVGAFDTRGDLAVVGDTPNIAARVEALAEPNTVVVSERTHRLVEPLFAFKSLGQRELRGVEAPMALYRATGSRLAESRFEAMHPEGVTAFVGRDEEIGLLKGRWSAALDGEGQVVLFCGEPGIGKSRITGTFQDLIAGDDHVRVQYQCSPFFTNSAFYPIIRQAEFAAGIEASDDTETKLDKLEAVLARSTDDVAKVAPLFATMMSLPTERYAALHVSPQRQKELIIEAAVAQIGGLAAKQPVLVVFEDVHWVDPTSLEALDHLVATVAALPVLVIITFRPEFEAKWNALSHVSLHTLTRLGRRQCEEMVERVTGDKPLPETLVDQIVAKTDGVPLFIEELTKAVIESDIVEDRGDRYALSGSVDAIAIPETLHDSLMARLDKLIPVKEVAQIGAAIGREFSYHLLAALSPMSQPDLDAALEKLVDSELVHRRGLPPNATYTFKHALVQDAAYDSLLRRDRQTLHKEIAEALIANVPGVEETEPELLAHHYTEARLIETAVPYWLAAAQNSLQASALAECIDHLSKGLAAVTTLPDSVDRDSIELDFQTQLGTAYMMWRGYADPSCGQAFQRANVLMGTVGESPEHFPVLWGLWAFDLVVSDYRATLGSAARALRMAEKADDPELLIQAWAINSVTHFWLGEFDVSYSYFKKVDKLYDEEKHGEQVWVYNHDALNISLIYASNYLWMLGYPQQAMELNETRAAQAKRLGHPFQKAFGDWWGGSCHMFRRDADTHLPILAKVIDASRTHGFPLWEAAARAYQGWWQIQQGNPADGLTQLEAGIEAYRATGSKNIGPFWSALLAEAYALNGKHEQACHSIDMALTIMEENMERCHASEVYRIKGKVALLKDSPDQIEAEQSFLQAIEVAKSQNAKGWELRTAKSLARLWQSQGRPQEAHDLLAPVYKWFTEGFDTADLKDAKALLDEPK